MRDLVREFARLPIGKGSELAFYVMLGAPEKEEDLPTRSHATGSRASILIRRLAAACMASASPATFRPAGSTR